MKDDLRKHTFIIIRKDGEYVASRMMRSNYIRMTIYAHEAAKTRDRALAERVARAIGGTMMLYNDITRDIREMKEQNDE